MLMGDLNARFGVSVRNLPVRAGIPDCDSYTYPVIPDSVERLSHNANSRSTQLSSSPDIVYTFLC